MKKIIFFILALTTTLVFAACGNTGASGGSYNSVDTTPPPCTTLPVPTDPPSGNETLAPADLPTLDHAPLATSSYSVPFDIAETFFAQAQTLFDEDGGVLWGFPFHVPIIVADPVTRDAAANRPDPEGYFICYDGVYFAVLPEDIPLSTFVTIISDFSGERWVIVPLGTVTRFNLAERRRHIAHYAMHWHQHCPDFFGGIIGFMNTHMNEEQARISIRLEITALIAAFRSPRDSAARLDAIHDALVIRAERRRIFDSAALNENRLETIEGLAKFTEWALPGMSRTRLLEFMEGFPLSDVGLESMFGYLSGAMYAFLLRETDKAWTEGINADTDLGQLLKEAMDIYDLRPFNEVNLNRYGYAAIAAEERIWTANQAELLERITELFVNQPTLRLYEDDIGEIGATLSGHVFTVAIPGLNSVWSGNVQITGSFGRLNVQRGYVGFHGFLYDRFQMVTAQDMEIDGNRVSGHTWTLELNNGYIIIPDGDNFKVVRVTE